MVIPVGVGWILSMGERGSILVFGIAKKWEESILMEIGKEMEPPPNSLLKVVATHRRQAAITRLDRHRQDKVSTVTAVQPILDLLIAC